MSRPRKQPRCLICTEHRWKGNRWDRHKNQRQRHKNPKNVLWQQEYHLYKLEEDREKNYDPDPYEDRDIDELYTEDWWLDYLEEQGYFQ